MEGCPPWTLFEPGDQLARFVGSGAHRPGNKVCIFPRYNRQLKLIRPKIALGQPFTACQRETGLESAYIYMLRYAWLSQAVDNKRRSIASIAAYVGVFCRRDST